jgi:MFS superfamily sulfate permease-like transporter
MQKLKTRLLGFTKNTLFEGILPIKRSEVSGEILAGTLLAIIAIPEVMGYAQIAGMPVITGIYTLLFPLVLFAIFCSSRHLIIGADSATAAILFSILITLAPPESPKYIALVTTVTLLCAIFLILARVLNLGFIGNFLSRTVLIGFLSGVGIQIALGQFSIMLGLETTGDYMIFQIISLFSSLSSADILTLLLSLIVVAVIVVSRRISKKIPGPLLAIVGTILLSAIFNFSANGISVVGQVPSGIPSITLPTFYLSDFQTLFTASIACLIVIIAQSAATSRYYAIKYQEDFEENKDILGLALANGVAGITGTFVVNGSPTKSEMAVEAGAKSQMAALITAGLVVVVLLFLTTPISFLPTATLASIVFVIGLKMIDFHGLKDVYHKVPEEFYLAILTTITVVTVGVLWGVVLAMIISILLHLRHSYNPKNSILVKSECGKKWIFESLENAKHTKKGLIIYRFNRDLYYANSDQLMHESLEIIKNAETPVKMFVLDTGGFSAIDYTSAELIKRLKSILDGQKIIFGLVIRVPELEEQLERLDIIKTIGVENIYGCVEDAIRGFDKEEGSACTCDTDLEN